MSYNGFFILKLESIVFREISLTPLLGTCHDCAQGGRSDHQHSSPGPVSSEQCPHRQWSPPSPTRDNGRCWGPHHINIASCCLAQCDLTTFQLHQRIKWLNTATSEFWFSSFCCWKWLPSHNNMNSGPILARAREQRDYGADVCCVLLLLMTTAQHQMTTAGTRLVFISDISLLLITSTIVVAAVAVVVIRFLCCSSIVRLRWGRDYNYNYNHWIIREL